MGNDIIDSFSAVVDPQSTVVKFKPYPNFVESTWDPVHLDENTKVNKSGLFHGAVLQIDSGKCD